MSDLNVALIVEAIDKATAPLRKVAGLSPRMRGNLLQLARHGKRVYKRGDK